MQGLHVCTEFYCALRPGRGVSSWHRPHGGHLEFQPHKGPQAQSSMQHEHNIRHRLHRLASLTAHVAFISICPSQCERDAHTRLADNESMLADTRHGMHAHTEMTTVQGQWAGQQDRF